MKKAITLGIVVACAVVAGNADRATRPARAGSPPAVRAPTTPPHVGTCEWHQDTDNNLNADVFSACDTGTYPIMGGCRSTNGNDLLYEDHPYENGDVENRPDANDPYDGLASGTGWYCEFNTTADHTAFVLCCP